jgi:hypothetical protein
LKKKSDMKKTLILFGAALAFASCSNSSNQGAEATGEATHQHAEQVEEVALDTTAILSNQKVFFKNLEEGQAIKLPYVLQFGVEGMEVEPAQGVVPNKGHHHLVIDGSFVPAATMVPMGKESEGYYHFGKGQLGDTLSLAKYPMLTPGKHSILLQFANGLHMSYGQAMSAKVNIEILP